MLLANLIRQCAARPRERMNSPLENRKVRLRGLGGPTACGVPCTGASATGAITQLATGIIRLVGYANLAATSLIRLN